MSSRRSTRLTRQQKRAYRNSPAAKAARERKAALPFQRACAQVRQLVDAGDLPPACGKVIEAMARCHAEHGKGVADRELLIGYGWRGDPARAEARTRSHAEPPVFEGIANEAGISRRWAIACVKLIAGVGILRRWFGGPNLDYRANVQPVAQRIPPLAGGRRGERTEDGERREHVQGIGGAGWANAYTVEGIPDPVDDDPRPPPEDRGPAPGPDPDRNPNALQRVRQMVAGLDQDAIERQRRRLKEQEERRLAGVEARGP